MKHSAKRLLLLLRLVFTIVCVWLLGSDSAPAETLAPNPAMARQQRLNAERLNQEAERTLQSHQEGATRVVQAWEKYAAGQRILAKAELKLAEAFDKGSQSEIAAGFKAVNAAAAVRDRGSDLIGALYNIERFGGSPEVEAWFSVTPEAAKPQLESYLGSRNKAVAAAAGFANALEADVDDEALNTAREEWSTALSEVGLQEKIWSRAKEVAIIAEKAAAEKNFGRVAKAELLKQLDAELFKLLKEDYEVQAKMRRLERKWKISETAISELLAPKKK